MAEADHWTRAWIDARDRLAAKGLLRPGFGALSLRRPDDGVLFGGGALDAAPQPVEAAGSLVSLGLHRQIYQARPDVGAVLDLGGRFSSLLPAFGGRLPQSFDEQARHLGPMPPAVADPRGLAPALAKGGQVITVADRVLCLAPTPSRLVLNAELFEKCSKAWLLASGAGGAVQPLPGWVRWIANSRLAKDRTRAAAAFGRGEAPVESKGY
jgi:hypothetical protein